MTIFYFTATGNSLAVAKQLNGTLISIPQIMQEGNFQFEDNAIGIVFPLYALAPPKMVREFLSRAKFKTEFLFAVGTYGFNAGATATELQKAVKPYGYQFDYINMLLMVDNFLPNFEIGEEIEKIPQKNTDACLKEILADVSARKHFIPKASAAGKAASAFCKPLVAKQDKGLTAASFLVNENCIKCGVCAKVCPAQNVTVSEKVVFGKQCESCYACLHACPQNALHLENEKSARRWRHPSVSLEEIINSNSGR